VSIRVHPGASRPVVGGSYAGALVVRVRERAVDGKATAAAVTAVAKALGLRPADVSMVSGATSRTKILEIPEVARVTFFALLDGPRPHDGTPSAD